MTLAELRALPPETMMPLGYVLQLIDGNAPPSIEPPRDLTVTEVAARLKVAEKTVTRWLNAGRLKGRRLPHRGWRVPIVALDELRQQGKQTE
jgi:excisionase family DNA binding protein